MSILRYLLSLLKFSCDEMTEIPEIIGNCKCNYKVISRTIKKFGSPAQSSGGGINLY